MRQPPPAHADSTHPPVLSPTHRNLHDVDFLANLTSRSACASQSYEAYLKDAFVQTGMVRRLTDMVFFKVRADGSVIWEAYDLAFDEKGDRRSHPWMGCGAGLRGSGRECALVTCANMAATVTQAPLQARLDVALQITLDRCPYGPCVVPISAADAATGRGWRCANAGVLSAPGAHYHPPIWYQMLMLAIPEAAGMAESVSIDCAATTQAVDISPIRSPQAVHSYLASRFFGRDIVEIGTRNGDGIDCFARLARTATAVELDPTYCTLLRTRASSLASSHNSSFAVRCGDYRNASLDADAITWWEQLPLTDGGALQHLRREQQAGRVRADAEAVLLFDPAWPDDVESWSRLHPYLGWQALIPYDERSQCEARQLVVSAVDASETCTRAAGTFVVAGVPVAADAGRAFPPLPC